MPVTDPIYPDGEPLLRCDGCNRQFVREEMLVGEDLQFCLACDAESRTLSELDPGSVEACNIVRAALGRWEGDRGDGLDDEVPF